MDQSSQAYIVVGMPRTGTSLTMGLLAAMGVFVGREMRKGRYNPNYFENQQMFDWINGVRGVKAKDIVAKLSYGNEKWGMKHPNLATRWSELAEFVRNPHFVVTHRKDFKAQATSHRAVIRKQSLKSLKIRHTKYYQTVARISEGLPRIDVYFEDWFNDNKEDQLRRLADFAGLTITGSARGLIDPKLKHF